MNETVKKAYEIAKETGDFEVEYLPEVEVGEIVELNDVWDGEGGDDDAPDNEESDSYGSYSYKITNDQWINYEFDIVEKKENPLDTLVKITKIELI